MKDRSGRTLELLVSRIFEEIEGASAEVRHNDQIRGRISQTNRQIDVSIRWKDAAGKDRLAIIEVKDWNRHADITHIDKLASVLRDTGADRGVLVANTGFTGTASKYAKNLGIEVYVPYNSETGHFDEIFNLPVVWTTLKPRLTAKITHDAKGGDRVHSDGRNSFLAYLSDDEGETYFSLIDRFSELWNSNKLKYDSDLVELHPENPVHLYVTDRNGDPQWRIVEEFIVWYRIERSHWLGRLDPSESRGLIDLVDRRILPSTLRTVDVPPHHGGDWEEIDDPSDLAVRTRGHLFSIEEPVMDPEEHTLGNPRFHDAGTGELIHPESR